MLSGLLYWFNVFCTTCHYNFALATLAACAVYMTVFMKVDLKTLRSMYGKLGGVR